MHQKPSKSDISKSELLHLISSYLEFLNSEAGKTGENKATVAPAVIAAAELKASRERARRKSGAGRALYGTVWCAWGIVLTALLYAAALPGAVYLIAWAILSYGVYHLLRGIPLRVGM